MIRRSLTVLATLLFIAPTFAATDPDAYRPVNSLRSFEDVLKGIRAQSLNEHRNFLKSLAELQRLQPYPLLLEDGTEIFRVSTFKHAGQGDQYYFNFRTKPCVMRRRLTTALSMVDETSMHGERWVSATTPYAEIRMSAGECLSSLTLVERISRGDGRMLYDGSVSAAQVLRLVNDMDLVSDTSSRFLPLEKIWRSLGSTHPDGVKVLTATHWHPYPNTANTYELYFADEGCIDATPFATFIKKADQRFDETWRASVRPSQPQCLESLRYYARLRARTTPRTPVQVRNNEAKNAAN